MKTQTAPSADYRIEAARPSDLPRLGALAAAMWDHPADALAAEFAALLRDPEAALFAARRNGEIVGFAQCQLRHDYVEGASSSPVGYLEGVYVAEGHRRQGVAGALLRACEAWARAKGCVEFASDCELDNSDSLRFHLRQGFTEANRIICFLKPLTDGTPR